MNSQQTYISPSVYKRDTTPIKVDGLNKAQRFVLQAGSAGIKHTMQEHGIDCPGQKVRVEYPDGSTLVITRITNGLRCKAGS